MELLWFFNPSLGADYGTFTCQVCGTEFNYSPRLECHCNYCAINELATKASEAESWFERWQYNHALEKLRDL